MDLDDTPSATETRQNAQNQHTETKKESEDKNRKTTTETTSREADTRNK